MEKEKSSTRKKLEYALRCVDGTIIPTGSIRQLRYLSRTTKSYDESAANVMGLMIDLFKTYAIYKLLF